jgi:hypothetical protein
MIIIIGLVILIAAVAAGVAGVLANAGSGHPLTHPFAVFGYHVTGSAGPLFLYGIVVGAAGLAGLSLLLAGARRTSRRGRQSRRGLTQSRRETAAASQDRDDLLSQRQTTPAYTVHDEQQNYTASTPGDGPVSGGRGRGGDAAGGQLGKWRLSGSRSASAQAAAAPAQAVNGHPASDIRAGDVPADVSAPQV